jgi:aminopeptidase-like protein
MLTDSLKARNLDFIKYPFSKRGSDERQFCWPTINLPYTCFFRSKFEEYDEYHTSKDDLNFISKEGLKGSMSLIMSVIDDFESSHFPISNTLGEPFLSKYMDYGVPGRTGPNQNAAKIRDFLCYCDGSTSTKEIAGLIELDLSEVDDLLEFLVDLNLVSI